MATGTAIPLDSIWRDCTAVLGHRGVHKRVVGITPYSVYIVAVSAISRAHRHKIYCVPRAKFVHGHVLVKVPKRPPRAA